MFGGYCDRNICMSTSLSSFRAISGKSRIHVSPYEFPDMHILQSYFLVVKSWTNYLYGPGSNSYYVIMETRYLVRNLE